MSNMRATMLLAGVLALSVTACGGGGGGGGNGVGMIPTIPTAPTMEVTSTLSPPPRLTHPVSGKALLPVESTQASQDEILTKAGAPNHAPGRKQIASTMELGSMTQSSRAGFLAGMEDSGGNLIGDNGLFTITSSFDWETDEGIETNPCLCSINYFAGFYDADGYGLMYMGGDNPGNVITAPGLSPAAKHGFIMGYYYQGTDDFGLFVDATSPTATLRNFGTARYATNIAGFMTGLDPSGHVQVDGRTTMTVTWGDRPSLSGKISTLYGDKVAVEQGKTMRFANHYTLATELTFHGTDWDVSLKAFHNGNIDCASRCEAANESRSRWGAMLVDNGSGGVDPFRLVGTFGLYQYRLDGKLVDWIGFVYGETPFDVDDLSRGLTDKPRSPGKALVRQVGIAVTEELSSTDTPGTAITVPPSSTVLPPPPAPSPPRTVSPLPLAPLENEASANSDALDVVVRDAATINSPYYYGDSDLALYVDYSQFGSRTAEIRLGFDGFNDTESSAIPFAVVSGKPFGHTLVYGSASYSGNAGGFYASNDGLSGGFVSTIDIGVDFRGYERPTLRGTLGYDFGGISGKLSMSGGTWNSSIMTSFSDGTLGCISGCQDTGSFARWSAQFIDVAGTGSLLPEGVIGKFGADGIRQQGNDEQVFKMYGIFAAVDEIPTPVWPAKSSFFPATPHGMLADAAGMYHRKNFKTGRLVDRYFYDTRIGTTVSVVTSGGNFVNPGGTIQLASNFWDWRTDDYANCYCTMFLTGAAFDSDGNEIKGGLSSSPNLRWSSIDYTDAKHGWVGGLWRLDLLPSEWVRHHGRTQLGIFVDGTVPKILPTSGSASYQGYGTGYAMPSTSTMGAEIESMYTGVSIGVDWGSGNSPTVSGKLSMWGEFTKSTIMTRLSLTMGSAQWSAAEKKFHAGSLGCTMNCYPFSGNTGTWEGLFVDTGDDQPDPGVFAGAFAMSRVSIITSAYRDSRITTSIRHGVWDLFGWFQTVPATRFDIEEELLKLPGRAVRRAVQDGFDTIYANAASTVRRDVLDLAGVSTVRIDPRNSWADEYGELTLHMSAIGRSNSFRTGFWSTNYRGSLTLGLFNTAYTVGALPQTGSAKYIGNAAGFYTSANDSGVMVGDVDMTIRFLNAWTISAEGRMNFEIGGTTGSFKMEHDQVNNRRIHDGAIFCDDNSGCTGGESSGKWGGQFTETDGGRPRSVAPGALIGSFGVNGILINNTLHDVLGVFSTVHDDD